MMYKMSYYCAIYTDRPLEEMLERHSTHPKTLVTRGSGLGLYVTEGDHRKDPNGADGLGLTEHFYYVDWMSYSEESALCLADDYLRLIGGKIYIIELSLSDGYGRFDGFEGLEGFEGLVEIMKNDMRFRDWRTSDIIKTLDLKDVSEKLHYKNNQTTIVIDLDDPDSARPVVSLEPYVIYEVVNSNYR
ncbi:MAG: hypothetical protein FWD81_00695 [Methanomassiliicoccaceae archaeon]|nr:hypothetical protein [Methanomassiliicoccaceae archaeon]